MLWKGMKTQTVTTSGWTAVNWLTEQGLLDHTATAVSKKRRSETNK